MGDFKSVSFFLFCLHCRPNLMFEDASSFSSGSPLQIPPLAAWSFQVIPNFGCQSSPMKSSLKNPCQFPGYPRVKIPLKSLGVQTWAIGPAAQYLWVAEGMLRWKFCGHLNHADVTCKWWILYIYLCGFSEEWIYLGYESSLIKPFLVIGKKGEMQKLSKTKNNMADHTKSRRPWTAKTESSEQDTRTQILCKYV